ncbi:MAG TPA: tyrosine-type recombinase/integrase [Reyranella sp.]|jgi:integrase|nr:tyrosine-type recombinase/integrase [Reyranella sp.]
MTAIRVSGIKTQRSKGRLYRYHRRTGVRIDIDPNAFPVEFLARVRELDEIADDAAQPRQQKRRAETLGEMFDAWIQSEEWAALKPQTRYSYERVIAPTTGSLARLRERRITELTTPFLVAVRDSVKKKHKAWLANYTIKVLRLGLAWGRLHGWCVSNPAKGVPPLPRATDDPVRNRMWTPAEFELVWHHAPAPLRRALAMASFAGMRIGDIVSVTWSSWDGESLSWRQSKTGHPVHVRAPQALCDELATAPKRSSQILTNHDGRPYTRDGLQSVLWQLTSRLEYLGLVKPGLCFHGLRHSLGATLYDLGLDREARKAALGHKSDAASAVYERDGNRRAASDRAFLALQRHLVGKRNDQ